jgi:hypothetical protein
MIQAFVTEVTPVQIGHAMKTVSEYVIRNIETQSTQFTSVEESSDESH